MFKGIVSALGKVIGFERDGTNKCTMCIENADFFITTQPGDSVACLGVCLTVNSVDAGRSAIFHCSTETLLRTNLGRLHIGSVVNLEHPLSLSDMVDGHLVSGHVDTVATVVGLEKMDGSLSLTIKVPEEIMRFLAVKGSVAVDGVSLTINNIDDKNKHFLVNIIPYTIVNTNMRHINIGDVVNIEVDLIMKYIDRLINFHPFSRNAKPDY